MPVTYKLLVPKELQTEENLRLANILGWCVELVRMIVPNFILIQYYWLKFSSVTNNRNSVPTLQLQAFFLIADDIMDGSETRRGQAAWYKKDNVGMTAFNDSLLLESCIYSILENHFKDKPYYGQIIHEFHRVQVSLFFSYVVVKNTL